MRRSCVFLLLLVGLATAVVSSAPSPTAINASWSIDVSKPVHAVSPDLWGIFFEEIGFSGQGGLHQQQIFNGNFESFSADYAPWTTLPVQSPARVVYELLLTQDEPLNAFNPTALQVTARITGGTRAVVGIANPGYWGINLRNRTVFDVSLFARSSSITAVTAQLISANGSVVYGSAQLRVSPRWAKVEGILHVDSADDAAGFALSWTVTDGASLYLDVISLLPRSHYADVPWLRPDLGRLVADMRPSVVRLPGGCFVEGGRLNNRFNWRRTLGPIEERRGHDNDVWDYFTENHLGIFEYLDWVESLVDAYGKPSRTVWVVNSGTAHTDSIPTAHISGWVRDALDSIDFIRGDAELTEFGRRRAGMGRRAPFTSLRYVAIGNEDCGKPYYESNYRVFFAALRAAHPDLVLIGNCEPTAINATEPVWDFHVYPAYDWFLSNAHQWDAYERSGSRVYVSEYATHGGQGKGNLRAALAESAYMQGMERNADLVVMAAYAPLLTNVEGRPVNFQQALLFNHREAYGTPSYWVQRMFARAVEGTASGQVGTLRDVVQLSVARANVSVNALLARVNATTVALVLKIVNFDAPPVNLAIDLTGVPSTWRVLPQVEVGLLSADGLEEENSFEQPLAVSEQRSVAQVGAQAFTWTAQPFSLTVLRLYATVSSADGAKQEAAARTGRPSVE